jgi:hypothetical protein
MIQSKGLSTRFLESDSLPEQIAIVPPWLTTGSLNMLYAPTGVGKSHFAFNLALTIAKGERWLREACRASKVLYVDGEMGARALLNRVPPETILGKAAENLMTICPDDFALSIVPSIGDRANHEWWKEQARDFDVVILDNYLTTCYPVDPHDTELSLWQSALRLLLHYRERGKAVVMVHHTSKGGVQYGSSLKENVMDVILRLRQFPVQELPQGLTWEIKVDKDRHNHFKRDNEFLMDVVFTDETTYITRRPIREARVNYIYDKLHTGIVVGDIVQALGVSPIEAREILSEAKKRRNGEQETW